MHSSQKPVIVDNWTLTFSSDFVEATSISCWILSSIMSPIVSLRLYSGLSTWTFVNDYRCWQTDKSYKANLSGYHSGLIKLLVCLWHILCKVHLLRVHHRVPAVSASHGEVKAGSKHRRLSHQRPEVPGLRLLASLQLWDARLDLPDVLAKPSDSDCIYPLGLTFNACYNSPGGGMDLFPEDVHLVLDCVELLGHPGLQSHLVLDNTISG